MKVHPLGFRIGIREPWRSRWTASKDFPRSWPRTSEIRAFIKRDFKSGGRRARVDIERTRESTTVIIHTARPGVLIGRKGVRAWSSSGRPRAHRRQQRDGAHGRARAA